MIKSLTVADGLYTPFWKRFKDKKVLFKDKEGNYKVNSFINMNITNVEVVINHVAA